MLLLEPLCFTKDILLGKEKVIHLEDLIVTDAKRGLGIGNGIIYGSFKTWI